MARLQRNRRQQDAPLQSSHENLVTGANISPNNASSNASSKAVRKSSSGGVLNYKALLIIGLLLINMAYYLTNLDNDQYEYYTKGLLNKSQESDQPSSIVVNQMTATATATVTVPFLAAAQQQGSTNNYQQPVLPSCKSIMQAKGSPYRDGYFLTRHSVPISWAPRVDGSRELRHPMCTLHRYSADDARQCLAKKHIHIAGDSLSRYLYLSLVWLIHKGQYPPRFGREDPCPHIDENGREMCSPPKEPNICMEKQWDSVTPPGKFPWLHFMQTIGSDLFDGYMEASAARDQGFDTEQIVENYLYVAPPKQSTASSSEQGDRPKLSFSYEIGWTDTPTPIHGFNFTNCAFQGTCKFTDAMAVERVERAKNMSFDFEQPVADALKPDGVMSQQLPPVDIAIYNRGYWGMLSTEKANQVMPQLHSFSQGPKGRCFYRSTMVGRQDLVNHERSAVRDAAWSSGCGYLDFAHLTEDFTALHQKPAIPPDQEYGNVNDERAHIYWDAAHFQPWVNEELNNVLLNVVCNNHIP